MVLVFGGINIDLVFPVPFLPKAGDMVQSGPARTQPGGKGANQAVAAARDGVPVTLVGAVGDDVLADAALSGLAREGIKLDHVVRARASTGRAAIYVDPSSHTTTAYDPGANRLARAGQVDDRLLRPNGILLLQMETAPAENRILIARARQRGMRIILNLSPAQAIDTDALRAVDLLVGNSTDLAWAGEHLGTGNNPASLYAALGVAILRMFGVQGAEVMCNRGFLHMPAFPVEMRDTTAAADCFIGILAASLERGADLPQAMRRSAVASALSATKLGAQSSMPTAAEIDAALPRAPEPTHRQAEVPD